MFILVGEKRLKCPQKDRDPQGAEIVGADPAHVGLFAFLKEERELSIHIHRCMAQRCSVAWGNISQ